VAVAFAVVSTVALENEERLISAPGWLDWIAITTVAAALLGASIYRPLLGFAKARSVRPIYLYATCMTKLLALQVV
jgi:hypothetical protein